MSMNRTDDDDDDDGDDNSDSEMHTGSKERASQDAVYTSTLQAIDCSARHVFSHASNG
jgi:hypothetical protein